MAIALAQLTDLFTEETAEVDTGGVVAEFEPAAHNAHNTLQVDEENDVKIRHALQSKSNEPVQPAEPRLQRTEPPRRRRAQLHPPANVNAAANSLKRVCSIDLTSAPMISTNDEERIADKPCINSCVILNPTHNM